MEKLVCFALAIVSLAVSTSALTCYQGSLFGNGAPSLRRKNCFSCSKTVTKYSGNGHSSTYATYGGIACGSVIVEKVAVATGSPITIKPNAAKLLRTVPKGSWDAACRNYYSYYGPEQKPAKIRKAEGKPACAAGGFRHHCSTSGGVSASHVACTCCSDNCNTADFGC